MALPLWTLFLATAGLIWYFRLRQARKDKLGKLKEIPGPAGLPIIGNALQLGSRANKQFTKWTEQYGDIYQVKLGPQKMVVVSDPKLHKELFSEHNTTGRLSIPIADLYMDTPGLGVVGAEGDKWEVHRRFLLRQLRDFGFGKSSMQALMMDEVTDLIERLKKKEGTPVGQMRATLRLAVVNSLWRILTSQRFEIDDPKLLRLANNTSEKFDQVIEKGQVLIFMPWLSKVIPESSGFNALREMADEIRIFMEETIQEKKRNYKEGDRNDFIDVYLEEMKKAENDLKSHFHGEIAEKQLATMLFDLFIAGSDTTATTTSWSILYLCKYPETQKKLQEEIDQITNGNTRRVTVEDRPNMPYTLALIDEILRFSSIVGDGLPHRALADMEFHGYLIEKDTLLQANMFHIHHSTKIWKDPENFRPERFLSPDGKFVRSESVQAFQVGKRQCVGEAMARDNVYLFLTNLFQQFSMKFDPNMEKVPPSQESGHAFLRVPLPYTVIMKDRLKN